MQNFPLNILSLPVWWYSIGLKIALKNAEQNFSFGVKKSGIILFARHIGEPLYGDYTRTGRIVSFFLRLALTFFKLASISLRGMIILIFLLSYLVILPFSILILVWQFLPAK
ncbi:MAG: hypothetical protein JNN11_00050 [Candidatus Doudnabacteria bacterium]|nr:hypothetical protein [Candidatus Doudnabacteria bacterium]